MEPNDRIERLLTEILETQRRHLKEYRRVTSESLEIQRAAHDTQSNHLRMYRRMAIAAGILILALLLLLLRLSLTFL